MTQGIHISWRNLGLLACGLCLLAGLGWKFPDAPTGNQQFASTTIDLGIAVRDINKSAEFYTKALGFTEAGGFDVPGAMAADAGLTDNKPFSIRVFVLGEGPTATKVKLFQVAGAQKNANEFADSNYGFRYLTLFVNDTTAAVARATAAGAKPLAKGPVQIPATIAKDTYLTVFKDPDGNLIEFVGPKK